MKLRLWRNQSIRVSKKAPLLADQNQNAGHQRQDAGHDHGDTDVKESHDSNKDQIDGEQKHSEIFGDVHEYFLSQIRRACTLKKRGRANVYLFSPRRTRRSRRSILLYWRSKSVRSSRQTKPANPANGRESRKGVRTAKRSANRMDPCRHGDRASRDRAEILALLFASIGVIRGALLFRDSALACPP